MEELIKEYKDIIIQISTPYGSGSGFYLKDRNLIVSNKHVVQGCIEVAINGQHFKKTVAKVLFTDAMHDIALLEVPEGIEMPGAELETDNVNAGETIVAIGHPLGLKYTATQGIVSKEERIFNGVKYIQIDAAINPGNSGGPLINQDGKVVGINTFIIKDGESLGFAVPAKYLEDALLEYDTIKGEFAIRCRSCSKVLKIDDIEGGYCNNCGNKIEENEYNPEPYRPVGVAKTIEDILTNLGKDVRLARIGMNAWDVEEGSALIKITYNNQSGFIFNDTMLCTLPKDNIGDLYEYLLKENYHLDNIGFSVFNQNIILGLIIYDEDLNLETGVSLYKQLIEKADYYDDILIEKFNAQPIEKDG